MRRVLHLVVSLVLMFGALAPLVECVDHWDHDNGPGHDTELSVSACLAATGVVLGVAALTRTASAAATSPVTQCLLRKPLNCLAPAFLEPLSTSSPPLISMRI